MITPAVKYAINALLYRLDSFGAWEHEIYDRLRPFYDRVALQSIREDLVSMTTLGWVNVVDERDLNGHLLRRYALADHMRPFLEYQLNLPAVFAFLDQKPASAEQLRLAREGS